MTVINIGISIKKPQANCKRNAICRDIQSSFGWKHADVQGEICLSAFEQVHGNVSILLTSFGNVKEQRDREHVKDACIGDYQSVFVQE